MQYDVIIIGGATGGSFLAKKLSEKGLSVLVVEKDSVEKVGSKMDIFHIAENEFSKYNLPRVHQGDDAWAFEFEENYVASPTNKSYVPSFVRTVGLHMHEYVLCMNREAVKTGAEFLYNTAFLDFIWENGEITGITCKKEETFVDFYGKIIVDCSGIGAFARLKLPSTYHMDYQLSENDLFYVILWYVQFTGEKPRYVGWPSHKSWIAPSGKEGGGIIGIGACHSFDYAEKMFRKFCSMVTLPDHIVEKVERGVTPFSRPPHSFVCNHFVACGDAVCLTKPNNGEGVTSSMAQLVIVADVLEQANAKNDFSQQQLWKINTEYNKVQGADFAFLRAVLVNAIRANDKEFEYFFRKGIIFNEKMMKFVNSENEKLSFSDISHTISGILGGLLTGNIRFKTIFAVLKGLFLGLKLQKLYKKYPVCPEKLTTWSQKVDTLWEKVGKAE